MPSLPATTPKWGMALDLERCIGCHACSVACKVENSVPLGNFRTKVYYYDFAAINPFNKKETMKRAFLPTLCMQCEDAPCLSACEQDAITRDADGIVRINENKCDSDRACIKACPYGAIHQDPVTKLRQQHIPTVKLPLPALRIPSNRLRERHSRTSRFARS